MSKTLSWEQENESEFTYDGVSISNAFEVSNPWNFIGMFFINHQITVLMNMILSRWDSFPCLRIILLRGRRKNNNAKNKG